MKVSLAVIALNEEKSLPNLLQDIKNQDFNHQDIEIILVDSGSEDSTKDIMTKFKEESDFKIVKILDNPEKIQSFGWNKAILNSEGEIIIRVDAHVNIPEDFVSKNVTVIESGEDVCGGVRPNVLSEESELGEILLLAEKSAFGSSIANYRGNSNKDNEKKYVDSIFHGAYRRKVFEDVGLFNTDLGRTEDNEIHYRIRKAGYKICMDPSIVSYQHVRPTPVKLFKQKYLNGKWCGLTFGVCPKCLKIFHFIPAAFTLALLAGVCLVKFSKKLLKLVVGSYMIVNLLMSIFSIKNAKKNKYSWTLPFIFLGIHLSYGIGTLVGLVKMPSWRKDYKKNHKDIKLNK